MPDKRDPSSEARPEPRRKPRPKRTSAQTEMAAASAFDANVANAHPSIPAPKTHNASQFAAIFAKPPHAWAARGVDESPKPRNAPEHILKTAIGNVAATENRRYPSAAPADSAGISIAITKGSASASPKDEPKPTRSAQRHRSPNSRIQLHRATRPRRFATRTFDATDKPLKSPTMSVISSDPTPSAAVACVPKTLPTKSISTVEYSCCTMEVPKGARQKRQRRKRCRPRVKSR